jgi:hypothetical protein
MEADSQATEAAVRDYPIIVPRSRGLLISSLKRRVMGLAVKKVAQLTEPGRYLDSNGRYLQVIAPTNRSWLLRYELRRQKRWRGLGRVKTFWRGRDASAQRPSVVDGPFRPARRASRPKDRASRPSGPQ